MAENPINKLHGIISKISKEKHMARTLAFLLYEFKKLPSDLTGKKAKITGTIGDMKVDLELKFEPEPLDSVVELLDFLKYKAKEEEKAIKRRR